MRKITFAALGFFMSFSSAAQATDTLSISACSAASVSFNWSVSSLDAAPYVTATDTGDADNNFQFVLFARSGSVITDFAGNWDGTDNRRVSLTLASTPPITANCP